MATGSEVPVPLSLLADLVRRVALAAVVTSTSPLRVSSCFVVALAVVAVVLAPGTPPPPLPQLAVADRAMAIDGGGGGGGCPYQVSAGRQKEEAVSA